jgi:hypothetical protein
MVVEVLLEALHRCSCQEIVRRALCLPGTPHRLTLFTFDLATFDLALLQRRGSRGTHLVMKATSPLPASAPTALCLDVAAEFTAQNGGVAPREEELRSVLHALSHQSLLSNTHGSPATALVPRLGSTDDDAELSARIEGVVRSVEQELSYHERRAAAAARGGREGGTSLVHQSSPSSLLRLADESCVAAGHGHRHRRGGDEDVAGGTRTGGDNAAMAAEEGGHSQAPSQLPLSPARLLRRLRMLDASAAAADAAIDEAVRRTPMPTCPRPETCARPSPRSPPHARVAFSRRGWSCRRSGWGRPGVRRRCASGAARHPHAHTDPPPPIHHTPSLVVRFSPTTCAQGHAHRGGWMWCCCC